MPRGYPNYQGGKPTAQQVERKTRFYKIWNGMNRRCTKVGETSYYLYGARGIKVMWESYEDFKNDMYKSYINHVENFGERETTIDRINGNKNYCKENCRWSTRYEQTQNRNENYVRKGSRATGINRKISFLRK